MNTWSGQPEESAWHWTPENCQKLGNVLLLLKCGTAAKREQAYQEFIELKRWFIEEEFDKYLNSLDDMRVSMGSEPLRQIMEEVRGERAPVTGWKAKEGKAIDPVMLPEMETIATASNEIKHREYSAKIFNREHEILMETMRHHNGLISEITAALTVKPVPVTRYDLFINLVKRGYHALEM